MDHLCGRTDPCEKSPFLVERLKVWMLPTLALIRKEQTVDYVVGFDDLGGKDDFTTEVLLFMQRLHDPHHAGRQHRACMVQQV